MARGRPRHDDILTPREREVLDLLRERLTNDGIAERLGISAHTAKYHVSEILTKLGLASREEAAAWAEPPRERATMPRRLVGFGLLTRVAVGVGVATALGVGILLALAASRLDDESPRLGKVVYVDGGNLWVQSLDGSSPRQITFDRDAVRPQWSASGDWILYRRIPTQNGIPYPEIMGAWVIRADGTGARPIEPQGLAAWAPNDDLIAHFVVGDALDLSPSVLVVERPDGSDRREVLPRLTGGWTLDRRMSPAWSPDGAWIVYQEQHADHDTGSGYSYIGLRAVRIDGSAEHEIFSAPLSESSGSSWVSVLEAATNGSPANVTLESIGSGQEPEIAGGLLVGLVAHLSNDPQGDGVPMLTHRDFFALSPDQKTIAFVRGLDLQLLPGSGGRTFAFDGQNAKAITLYSTSPIGHDPNILPGFGSDIAVTPPDMVAVSPMWSPDGSRIAFVGRPDTGPVPATDPGWEVERSRRIWTVDPTTFERSEVATTGADCRQERPLWSGDGQDLLFACLDDGPVASLWVVSSTGGIARQVVGTVGEPPGSKGLLQGNRGHVDWAYFYDWWRP